MALDQEIADARKEIVADGYDMSVGELINLYKDAELQINPAYQRLFRWDTTRKTRFIESILLGLPLPPIFVYQQSDGVWELIDGLQRLSTILEFVGALRDQNGNPVPPLRLEGTQFLPSLADKQWEAHAAGVVEGIGPSQQIQFKRARMRVEILKQESDTQAKYELFQRLNTGGINLAEQEVRNSVGFMIDPTFQNWLVTRAEQQFFLNTVVQTDAAKERQSHVELVLRYLAFRSHPYVSGLDVHEYLDAALLAIASNQAFDRNGEEAIFQRTFETLNNAMGGDSFKRWDGHTFGGKFLMSVYEVVALGISRNIDSIQALPDPSGFIRGKCQDLWHHPTFLQHSGAGVRGTTRLAHLLPMAADYFQP